ncbi:MAG: hypothetical protein RL113_1329, partial [Pseudomonadota bacterium]
IGEWTRHRRSDRESLYDRDLYDRERQRENRFLIRYEGGSIDTLFS